MINEDLEKTVEDMILQYKSEKFDLRKGECLEYLSLFAAMGLLYVGDIKHFIEMDSYSPAAFLFDTLLGAGMFGVGSYIFNNPDRTSEINLLKQKVEFLKTIKDDLENGVCKYDDMNSSEFKNMFDVFFASKYYPEALEEDKCLTSDDIISLARRKENKLD